MEPPLQIFIFWELKKLSVPPLYLDTNYSQIIARGATVNNPVNILLFSWSVVLVHQEQAKRLH